MVTTTVIDRAERDIKAGDCATARRRLMSHVATVGYSAQVCEKIARISVQMKDPIEAGRWYFLIDSGDPEAKEAIGTFTRSCRGLRERVASALPRCMTTSTPRRLPGVAADRLSLLPQESQGSGPSAKGVPHKVSLAGRLRALGCLLLLILVIVAAVVGFYTIITGALQLF